MKSSIICFVFSPVVAVVLTGCIGYDGGTREQQYGPPPTAYMETGPPDDYVYYPRFMVYYSRNRHEYVYQEGHSWVSRPAPSRVSVEVLAASPSIQLDFHDAPSIHHGVVVKQYPKRWTPPASGGNRDKGNREPKKGNDRGDRR